MQHFGILRTKLKEGIRYNESKEIQELVIERKRRNQSVIGAFMTIGSIRQHNPKVNKFRA